MINIAMLKYILSDIRMIVGSTIQPLHKRFYDHKSKYFSECNTLLYTKMRDTNNIDDWYIELYENYPCTNKEQLNRKEGEVIRKIATVNKRIQGTYVCMHSAQQLHAYTHRCFNPECYKLFNPGQEYVEPENPRTLLWVGLGLLIGGISIAVPVCVWYFACQHGKT
jgi:hypothetical protein